ncbi:hypothetical protein UT300003_17180 [Clostridium sardiniense]
MPSAPKIFDKYMENANPNKPVVILEAVSMKEFLKKLSLAKINVHPFKLQ